MVPHPGPVPGHGRRVSGRHVRRHCHGTEQAAATLTAGYWGHATTHPSAGAGRAGLEPD